MSITDVKSGIEYSGSVSSITIHHDEIPLFSHLKLSKSFSFISEGDMNKDLNEFLSEEEYLNVVRLKVDGKVAYINGARRRKIKKTNIGVEMEIGFRSINF